MGTKLRAMCMADNRCSPETLPALAVCDRYTHPIPGSPHFIVTVLAYGVTKNMYIFLFKNQEKQPKYRLKPQILNTERSIACYNKVEKSRFSSAGD